jgi:hypothetical protein
MRFDRFPFMGGGVRSLTICGMEWFGKWSIGVLGAAFRRLLRGGEWTEWTEWTERTKMPGRRPAFRRRQSGK